MKTVRNINDKTRHQCHCGSWNAHLHAFGGTGETAICSELNCTERANIGAHVQFEGDSTWYIVALCMKHNNKDYVQFKIKKEAKRALASVTVTCEPELLKKN